MAIFCGDHISNSAKKFRFLILVLKDPFSSCHTCNETHVSSSGPEEGETPIADFDDVQEVVKSMIRSRAMEAKFRRKGSMLGDNYTVVLRPTSGELYVNTAKQQACDDNSAQKQQENSKANEEMDDFASAKSHFSPCITTTFDDSEAFFSVKTNLSYCSSSKDPDLAANRWWVSEGLPHDSSEHKRRLIIQEVCHCEGWPFGLCRKALLLPPLPKSPSESWSWCKSFPKMVKTV